jgi:hypothetical protein
MGAPLPLPHDDKNKDEIISIEQELTKFEFDVNLTVW